MALFCPNRSKCVFYATVKPIRKCQMPVRSSFELVQNRVRKVVRESPQWIDLIVFSQKLDVGFLPPVAVISPLGKIGVGANRPPKPDLEIPILPLESMGCAIWTLELVCTKPLEKC